MANPMEVKYSKSHEWVEFLSDTEAVIGLTDYAQKQLGDIVFINLPVVGDEVTLGEAACDIESVKAVSDIYSPILATISSVNDELADTPYKINEAPFESWLFKVKDIRETEQLLTYEEYEIFCSEDE